MKRRNAAAPDATDEEFPLCITCTCKLAHENLTIKWGRGGVARSVKGNTNCWYNLFKFIVQGLGEDSETQFLRHWNATAKKWGKRDWSYDKVQKSMALWAAYCGVDDEPVNNCWARKTYRIRCSEYILCMNDIVLHVVILLVTLGLRDLQLPAASVMAVTGHKSEAQMRRDYNVMASL